jgi:hypothetical protein
MPNENETKGELIWLEKYVQIFVCNVSYPGYRPDKYTWKISREVRLKKLMLEKLERGLRF